MVGFHDRECLFQPKGFYHSMITMIRMSKSSLVYPSFLSAFAFLDICVASITVVSQQHRKISNINSWFIKSFHVVNIVYVSFKGVSQHLAATRTKEPQ